MSTTLPRATEPAAPLPRFSAPWARWPKSRVILASACGGALITALFFSPRFWLWVGAGVPLGDFISLQPEFHRAFYALEQLKNPWQPIANEVNRVIEWRLLFPVLAHYLGLPVGWFLALPHLGSVLALGVVASVTWRYTADPVATACGALLSASCSWFFVSTGWLAYFDSWLVLALLLASFGRSRWTLFGAALLAPWIDERFILALPLCASVRFFVGKDSGPGSRGVWPEVAVLLAGVAPYLAVRIGAELSDLRTTSKGYWSGRPLLPASIPVLAWGAWNGLRLAWIPVWQFIRNIQPLSHRGAAGLIIAPTLLVNLCVADDLSRSVSIGIPLTLAGVFVGWRTQPIRARRTLLFLTGGNLLLPAAHVIASAHNLEEPYHSVPILNAYAERARADDPPFFASPYTYDKRGIEAFTAGRTARARASFDLALRFDPAYQPAHANRGILRVLQGEVDAGMAELDDALAKAPYLFEQQMQRAAFRHKRGDIRGALDDVEAALRYIPADWPRRQDAERFAQNLRASSPQ